MVDRLLEDFRKPTLVAMAGVVEVLIVLAVERVCQNRAAEPAPGAPVAA